MEPVRVEPAVPGDAPAILALHRRVLAEGDWFITEPDELIEGVEVKVAAIRDAARPQGGIFLVARQDHLLVGWAQVSGGARRRNAHVGRLEMMVDSRARGAGVGSALLAGVIEHAARRAHLQKLSLNVFAHNTAALALYRRFAFVEEGRREREYRFPDGSWRGDVLMSRWLKGG